MITAGIDAGSRAIKVVLAESGGTGVVAAGACDQGVEQAELARGLFERVLRDAGINRSRVARIVATGYGRDSIEMADTTITEITCHACGIHCGLPHTRTVIDIGGQDSKVIRLGADGKVHDFMVNDRCAAGTGRFLEMVASRLETGIDALGSMAAGADKPSAISSMCAVFAETEIVGLLASGETSENIVAGVQAAIASRIASMAGRRLERPVAFTGGVALVPGMDRALEKALNCPVTVAAYPQMTGALGAAILAGRAKD